MRQYALDQTAILLHKFTAQLKHSETAADPDSIHDLRVSIRRLSRCLRVFSQFYPAGSWKRIRRRLSGLMHAAGAVRDCDIALELLAEAGVPPRAAIVRQVRAQRSDAARNLAAELRRWKKREYPRKWRERLKLG
jgi:CHAD domain-containing protein